MPLFDVKCNECEKVEEVFKRFDAEWTCSECGGECTTLYPAVKGITRAKQPYDYLDSGPPRSKRIKSFANDRRKGGKDTT